MADYIQGQRWLVDSEPELGLGMVQSLDARSVLLYFPESDTERHYTLRDAPLTRLILEVGDSLEHRDQGSIEIAAVHPLNGLIIYESTSGQMIPETELADTVKRNNPIMRLMTGQTDHPNWFNFRSALNRGIQTIWNQRLNGLLGTRSSLLNHQLYVAAKATEQSKVRVLLSDEVGLGKTIEAGLIINRLAQQGRAKRILVCVPPALQAQWLVELVRRFALTCELYQSVEHDFGMGQVHLVTHEQLTQPDTLTDILNHDWDMLVIDEAHHLSTTAGEDEIPHWTTLAHQASHLLLLTATPEQLGLEAHFGRLQLLDAQRFTSFEEYQQGERQFAQLTELARSLSNNQVSDADIAQLKSLGIDWHDQAEPALSALLDRHGTGRVVYRNTRKGVAGFHTRSAQLEQFDSEDSRVKALVAWLKANPNEKALLITHEKETAKDLAFDLMQRHGLNASSFQEDLDLIERDRAAAHFADDEDGAQILVCSEIGGEGRNFQFCHHLFLWDIPTHPNVLEQRIGRLDRIGQTQTINIHAFLVAGTADDDRYEWYNEHLNCVEHIQPAASAIHDRFFTQWQSEPSEALNTQVKEAMQTLTAELESGRDILLELNSCREPEASTITQRVTELEQNHPLDVVEMAANLLNIHFEMLAEDVYELIPSSNMLIPTLPGIPEGGATVTFSRAKANAREDALFLSWEHPFIQGLSDVLNSTDLGQASIALLETEQVPAGQLLLEVQWSVKYPERFAHAIRPHVQEALFRTLTLEGGDSDLSNALPEAALEAQVKTLPLKVARKMIRQAKERISPIYESAQRSAETRFDTIKTQVIDALADHHRDALERLTHLETVNPLVTKADIASLELAQDMETIAAEQCEFQTDGVRLILCAPPGAL